MSELDFLNRRLDIIQKNQDMILLRLNDITLAVQGINPDNWIDSLEVMKILHISPSTLYRRRKTVKLVPRFKGGSYLYFAPDIYDCRNEYLK